MGRLMHVYDVLNEVCLLASLLPIKTSENEVAKDYLKRLAKMSFLDKFLLIYDAKFAGFDMIYKHLEEKFTFLIRCSPKFNVEVYRFVESKKGMAIVYFRPTKQVVKDLQNQGFDVTMDTRLKVRLVRIDLPNGIVEVLITNLFDKRIKRSDFSELYQLRWKTETNYDALKNKMQIEVFSGHSVYSILQDFHAAVVVLNLQSCIEKECEQELVLINKRRKYDYAVNQNIAIGHLKNRIVLLFLNEQPEEILDELKALFINSLEPVRPDRTYERIFKVKHLKGKYKTQTNYKRAI